MGSAWCKTRAATTDDSKSTVGRVIVRCVNQMCPAQRADPAAVPRDNSAVPRLDGDKETGLHLWGKVSPPLPERPPPHSAVSSSAWESVVLTVPDAEPPVPPPRTKRRRRRTRSSVQPLTRSFSLAARPNSSAPDQATPLRRVGSACELSPVVSSASPGITERPKFVFDFTSYSTARTPPPSPARDDGNVPTVHHHHHRSKDILRDLGLPSSLREEDKLGLSRASSGRSSMTPSLSELEAALSDLLEAGAAREDDEEAETAVKAGRLLQAPPLPKEVIA